MVDLVEERKTHSKGYFRVFITEIAGRAETSFGASLLSLGKFP